MVLSILGLAQQVGERHGFERARARGAGVPEGVHHSEVPPRAHRAKRAGAHSARRVDAVHANHADRPIGAGPSEIGLLGRGLSEEKFPIVFILYTTSFYVFC